MRRPLLNQTAGGELSLVLSKNFTGETAMHKRQLALLYKRDAGLTRLDPWTKQVSDSFLVLKIENGSQRQIRLV